jgi:hypothetical protein
LLLVPFQSVFFCRIWREFVLVPFQSASIDAASWREVSFWFLLSQRLLLPHLAGSCFWFLFSQQVCFRFLFSQRLLLLHFAGRFFLLFTSIPVDSLVLIAFYIYVRYLSIGSS